MPHNNSTTLPLAGYLRLTQIIGQAEITPEQAKINRTQPRTTTTHRPLRPRPAISALIPVSKAHWYAGIKAGVYPPPVHLGRTSVWRVEDIRALLDRLAA